jgi:hypothetical protein
VLNVPEATLAESSNSYNKKDRNRYRRKIGNKGVSKEKLHKYNRSFLVHKDFPSGRG